MKPPPFDYVRARNLDHALELLAAHGTEAKILAGGQSLVPMMNLRMARPGVLIDINHAGLDRVEITQDEITFNATVRQQQLVTDPAIRAAIPMVADAASYVAHPAIRARGTLCGSLSHADPTAELALAAVCLGARLQLRSASSERIVDAEDFLDGPFTSTLEPGELVASVSFSRARRHDHMAFAELAERSGDFAIASVAAQLTVRRGRVRKARVATAGGAGTPTRSREAEALLEGEDIRDAGDSSAMVEAVAQKVRDEVTPRSDAHASSDYKRHVLEVLTARVMATAIARAAT